MIVQWLKSNIKYKRCLKEYKNTLFHLVSKTKSVILTSQANVCVTADKLWNVLFVVETLGSCPEKKPVLLYSKKVSNKRSVCIKISVNHEPYVVFYAQDAWRMPGQYIVVMRNGTHVNQVERTARRLRAKAAKRGYLLEILQTYSGAFHGFLVKMSSDVLHMVICKHYYIMLIISYLRMFKKSDGLKKEMKISTGITIILTKHIVCLLHSIAFVFGRQ